MDQIDENLKKIAIIFYDLDFQSDPFGASQLKINSSSVSSRAIYG